MHRSGINAVGRWLLRQSRLKSRVLYAEHGDWVESEGVPSLTMNCIEEYTFISQINHPDHFRYSHFIRGTTVMTIERESYTRIEEIVQKHWGFTPIIIIREFKNWLASVCKMQGNCQVPILDIDKYYSHFTEPNICGFSGEGYNPHIILYDKWCIDADYRREICYNLNLKYTNCGFRDVSDNGGGSSFDGTEFHGRAQEMKTGERWLEYADNPVYKAILDSVPQVVEASRKKFGNING